MMKSIEVTGKTETIAIDNALKQLGLDRDDISVEVISRAKTGFLGIGSQPARIKVTYEVPDEKAPETSYADIQEPTKESKTEEVKEEKVSASNSEESVNTKEQEKKVVETIQESVQNQDAESTSPRQSTLDADVESEEKESTDETKTPIPSDPSQFEEGSVEQRIYTFLTGLLAHMDSDAKVSIKKEEDNIYQVELIGEGLGSLIGRRGETLDAIQQLTNYSVNRGQNHRVRIHLDAENYRAKREESLQRLARKTAGKVVKNRRNITLEPMNAYERHVIHTALQDYRNVTTYSVGTEPNRRIVIAYVRNDQKSTKQQQ